MLTLPIDDTSTIAPTSLLDPDTERAARVVAERRCDTLVDAPASSCSPMAG